MLNLDGKTFQSVRLLLTKPGFLSLEQFQGRRVRYVSPIRLYLLLSLLYFAVAALAPSSILPVTIRVKPDDSPQEMQRLEQQKRDLEAAASPALVEWVPRAMFVLVPLFAGLVALVIRRSGRNYPQHLYFSLHVHAAWFFAGAVAGAVQIRTIPIVTPLITRIASCTPSCTSFSPFAAPMRSPPAAHSCARRALASRTWRSCSRRSSRSFIHWECSGGK